VALPAGLRIEALRDDHERARFCSGTAELDDYLHLRAGQDARRRVAAPFVLISGAAILGYYTLSAYSLKLDALPPGIARRLPRYPLVPATLIGRLAVSRTHQGMGLGSLLLVDALQRSYRNIVEVASAGVVVHAIDENARAFYLHHEFAPLPDHPDTLFLGMKTIEKLFR
jgi:GNAT superfamily N-acetyltransferase